MQGWFITFTCYQWLNLFDIAKAHNLVYNWFDYLKENRKGEVLAFVIMPNHVHAIIYLYDWNTDLNKLVGNGKRFMAYDLVEKLKARGQIEILHQLQEGLTEIEKSKGQLHRVFEPSFDAKWLQSWHIFQQKLNYIHLNPVRGKWKLVETYTDYEHSSASFYELGISRQYAPYDFRDLWLPA